MGLEGSAFSFLSDPIILQILYYILPNELLSTIPYVCKDFWRLSDHPSLWSNLLRHYFPHRSTTAHTNIIQWKRVFHIQRQINTEGLVCFHSKLSYRDDILGIPLTFSKNPNTGKIDKISTTMDLISYEAFQECGVRKTVWKQSFTHWMPLFISDEHIQRAFPDLEQSITNILSGGKKPFAPSMVFDVFPQLMNTMVVSIMSGDTHASLVALEGYCAFHRMLLLFAERYPEVRKRANETAFHFIQSENNRTKDVVPSLGDFLPTLTIADRVSWNQVSIPYLQENFDRNALWTIKKYPGLARVSNDDSVEHHRLKKTFEATIISMRLLMFHVYFFTHIARPAGVSIPEVITHYDLFFSRPSSPMKDALQQKCKEILQQTHTWDHFFQGIGMKPPTPLYLTRWLKQAVRNSERKGYHGNRGYR